MTPINPCRPTACTRILPCLYVRGGRVAIVGWTRLGGDAGKREGVLGDNLTVEMSITVVANRGPDVARGAAAGTCPSRDRNDRGDVRSTSEGLVLRIRHSKGDQEGEGAEAGIARGSRPHTCPVRAMETWLRCAGITYGAVFPRLTAAGRLRAPDRQRREKEPAPPGSAGRAGCR
jgi:hypothetical protein